MDTLLQDLRYALRTLRKTPGFTLAAVLTLALGISATAAIFSMANAILLRPFPFPQADRLVMLQEDKPNEGAEGVVTTYPTFLAWRDGTRAFEAMGAVFQRQLTVRGSGDAERFEGAEVSADMFRTLRISPSLGRGFTEEEMRPGGPRVVILGDGMWRTRFGGDARILGRSIAVNGEPHTVVGVMAAGFNVPERSELWTPLALDPVAEAGAHRLAVVARLAAGATLAQARAELTAVNQRLADANPAQHAGWVPRAEPLHEAVTREVRPMVLALLGAVGFLLLIACANVANLMLARAAGRMREVAIRASLGASRRRMLRQLLTESVLLSSVGAALGLLMAAWWVDLLLSAIPVELPYWLKIAVDWRVVAFTATLGVATGVLFGLAPALIASGTDVQATLKDGGRGATTGGARARLRSAFVVSQMAFALILLVGGLLMVRSFLAMMQVDPGFRTHNIVSAELEPPRGKYATDAQRIAFFDEVLRRASAIPGVQRAATVLTLPVGGNEMRSNFSIQGRPPKPAGEQDIAQHQIVSPGFFEVMDIQLLRGRGFTEADGAHAPLVAIINHTLAERFFAGEDAIGKQIRFGGAGDGDYYTIVGVAEDIHQSDMNQREIPPDIYRPYAQQPFAAMTLVLRSQADAASTTAALRRVMREIDRDVPLHNVRTIEQVLSEAVWDARFFGTLFGAFAAVALLLAALGLYGVVAHGVAQRTHEMGIRMALGATAARLQRLVLGQGMRLVAIGMVLGLVGAVVLTRVLEAALYGVSASDPLTYIGVALLLGLVAALASYIPARRAARLDPVVALRND